MDPQMRLWLRIGTVLFASFAVLLVVGPTWWQRLMYLPMVGGHALVALAVVTGAQGVRSLLATRAVRGLVVVLVPVAVLLVVLPAWWARLPLAVVATTFTLRVWWTLGARLPASADDQ